MVATQLAANRLGSAPAVYRRTFTLPMVLERYADGATLTDFRSSPQRVIMRRREEYELEEMELQKLFDKDIC